MRITTLDGLVKAVDYFLQYDKFQFDVETLAFPNNEHRGDPRRNRVHWLSMATTGLTVSIPFSFPNGDFSHLDFPLTPTGQKRKDEGLPLRKSDYSKSEAKATKVFTAPPKHLRFDDDVREILDPLFFSDRLKINQNISFDIESLAKHFGGRIIPGPYFDTMIASFLIDSRNRGSNSLDDIVLRELEYPMVKGVGKDISKHSFDEVDKYSFLDGKWTWLVHFPLQEKIAAAGMEKLMRLEMDVLEAVIHMEHTGAPIDRRVLDELDVYLRADKERIETEIYRVLGRPWNIGSNQERQDILYLPKKEGGRGLKQTMLTDGGKKKKRDGKDITIRDLSVAENALQKFQGKDPLVDLLLEWDDVDKLIGSFIVPYIGGEVTLTSNGKQRTEMRESLLVDGRIHARFNQIGAETGRFSSSNPNLQQVPARSERGKKIRSAFVTAPGYVMLQADYAQIEPRLIADLSEDENLIEVFLDGRDIYTALADPFGLDRAAGKILVLATCYGVGPDKVSNSLGLTMDEAKTLLYEDFPHAYPKIERLKRQTIHTAKRRKPVYVQTLLGRRRYLPDLWSTIPAMRRRAERQAFNTLIQGTAADINKIGLVRAHKMLAPIGGQVILTVHDETVALVPEQHAEEGRELMKEALEGVGLLRHVPLLADTKIVTNWGEAK